MTDSRVFLRIPLNFKDKFKVYVPSLEEVLSCDNFGIFKPIFTISQEDIQDDFVKRKAEVEKFPTPLEYLLANCYNDKKIEQIVIEGFNFFLHSPVSFLYDTKAIFIGDLEEEIKNIKKVEDLNLLTEENYFDFQNLIRKSLGEKEIEPPNPNENPRIAKMKAKARYRDRIKAKKGVSGGISLQTSLEALCCMGIGLTPLNIGRVSYSAISRLMNRSQAKEKYETDIQSLMAGAKASKVHPVYWIKDDI